MKKVVITKAYNDKFIHRENMPEEVYNYFFELAKKYNHMAFIVDLDPFDKHSDIQVMVFDEPEE